ncbi:DUF3710 domain-containing protein [Actinokineospora iranica]|uniref:DUF3710 domain-containing protein n=1 Tax=Actinokineospora iranica TaxID=1271860 RepID=A0A1G6LP26_9PSEU|nr:DUF3710 domain-containing protein [Actinokineospora iranica]SDC44951.1 Protein of unknown function [Actinokineospora iranica]
MALFGRGRRKREAEEPVGVSEHADADFDAEDDLTAVEAPDGPYDEADAPDDDFPRLDLGSVRIPVPDGAQLQVEMDPAGPVRAVHVLTGVGQLTLNAYAAPRSGGLWREVCGELAEQLRGDGATVRSAAGDWGQELIASLGEVSLRFVGVDGPRWMLRGVVAGPPEIAETSARALRELVRNTVVVRGSAPMPVRTPLQIDLPPAIAEHIAAQNQVQ